MKSGDDRHNVFFSKNTKTWSVKPIKDVKSLDVFSSLVDLMEKLTELPDIPRNITSVEKPNKNDIVKNQKSRFAI